MQIIYMMEHFSLSANYNQEISLFHLKQKLNVDAPNDFFKTKS